MEFSILEEKNNEVNDLMRTILELGREEKDLELKMETDTVVQ